MEALLADLRNAHDLYLDALGQEIARMERIADAADCLDFIAPFLRDMRELRVTQERNLRALERIHESCAR